MPELRSLKEQVNLVALVGQYTRLRRESAHEYSGPCPCCGGHDRLHVHDSGWFFCRQCHPRRGDVIEFLRWVQGLTFLEAVQRLTAIVGSAEASVPAPRAPRGYPESDWQRRAWRLVETCERVLWSEAGRRARDYLARRGLGEATLLAFRIGFHPGGTVPVHGMHLVRGIVIPWWRDEVIWKVNVRTASGYPKYRAVAGSVEGGLFGTHYLGRQEVLLLTEGEFDAMLVWQEAGEWVDVSTAGSAAARVRAEWLVLLRGYRRILVCTDNDAAGHEAAQQWLALLGRRAVRLLPPGGSKDITAGHLAGHDVRAWLAGVCG